jgi:hypothetical protein
VGIRALSPRIKQPGCEADYSPTSSNNIKNGRAIPAFPHMSSWHRQKEKKKVKLSL